MLFKIKKNDVLVNDRLERRRPKNPKRWYGTDTQPLWRKLPRRPEKTSPLRNRSKPSTKSKASCKYQLPGVLRGK